MNKFHATAIAAMAASVMCGAKDPELFEHGAYQKHRRSRLNLGRIDPPDDLFGNFPDEQGKRAKRRWRHK